MTTNCECEPQYSNGDGGSDHISETTDHNGNSGGLGDAGVAGLAGLMEPRLFATMQRNLAANSDFLRQFQVKINHFSILFKSR